MKYNKVIFVCRDNLLRSPIAAAIMNHIKRDAWLEAESRGIIVLFPEPYHMKAYALLRNHGIVLANGTAVALEATDFGPMTLILTMERDEKQLVLEEFAQAQNVYTIMEFAGGSGNIMDPYGGDNDIYAMFLASITNWVTLVEEEINRQNDEEPEDIE